MAPTPIPASHLDLVDGPYWAALTTLMPDGAPQTTPVWCNREGDHVLINTMRGFRKEKNMRGCLADAGNDHDESVPRDKRGNPSVSLLIVDPRNPLRHVEIRGTVVGMTEEGALDHLDALTRLYYGRDDIRFFGGSVPAELQASQFPVRVTIAPQRVRVEG